MIISELIKVLQKALGEYGDLPAYLCDLDEYEVEIAGISKEEEQDHYYNHPERIVINPRR